MSSISIVSAAEPILNGGSAEGAAAVHNLITSVIDWRSRAAISDCRTTHAAISDCRTTHAARSGAAAGI